MLIRIHQSKVTNIVKMCAKTLTLYKLLHLSDLLSMIKFLNRFHDQKNTPIYGHHGKPLSSNMYVADCGV